MSKKTPRNFTPIESFTDLYTKSGKQFNDKVLFRYYSKEGSIDTLNYGQFKNKIERLAAGFDSLGLAEKRIALIGETHPDWLATYIAAISIGSVIIPLDKELVTDEIANFLNRGQADAFVFSRSFNKKYDAIRENTKSVTHFIPMDMDGNVFSGAESITDLSAVSAAGQKKLSERGYTLPQNTDRNKMSAMLFTSGTTGTSKCVMLSENNLTSCINACCATVDFSAADVLLSVLPIHHTYECACTMAAINYGAEICINDSLKNVLKNLNVFRPTGMTVVPMFVNTFYKRIWDEAKKKGKEDLLKRGIAVAGVTKKFGLDISQNLFKDIVSAFGGRLSKLVCGGAAMDPEMVKNFGLFGITIVEGYGITECSPLISVSPYYRQKFGSVGPAVPSCTVRILDATPDENGKEIGEIAVKGSNVMLGYYMDKEATDEVLDSDGWFRTGDLGYMDKDGYIYITGRKKNVIILNNGKNVFPEEIEEYLYKIDIICECVVTGRKNDLGEVVLTAVVYPAFDKFKGKELSEIADEVKARILEVNKILPSFKQIRNVEIKKTEFEKTTTKKIKRFTV